jgi:hypothetical protein
MRPHRVGLVLVGLAGASQSIDTSSAQSAGSRGVDWGISWRTGSVATTAGDPRIVLLGSQRGLPVDISASNRDVEDLVLAPAELGLAVVLRRGEDEIPVLLRCDDTRRYMQVQNGSTIRSEVAYGAVTLTPDDSVESRCEIVRADHSPFALGRYRLSVTVRSWPLPRRQSGWWDIEIREAVTTSERHTEYLNRGSELMRGGDVLAAAAELERAAALLPRDITGILLLAGAYEKLGRHADAARLIERLLLESDDPRGHKIDPSILARRAARGYLRSGDEVSARRVLRNQKFDEKATEQFISRMRRQR